MKTATAAADPMATGGGTVDAATCLCVRAVMGAVFASRRVGVATAAKEVQR